MKNTMWLVGTLLKQHISQNFLIPGSLYTHQNAWIPQSAFIYVGYVYLYLLFSELKLETLKIFMILNKTLKIYS